MRRTILPVLGLFLVALIPAIIGLNPTFFLDDSPETVAAGVSLGIPHPPGYPLYTLLSRLFTIIPVGTFMFRVNLLSAVMAALVVVLLFLILARRLGLSKLLAGGMALLWIAGATTYPAALSAKGGIYHLTAFLLAGLLYALLTRRFLLAAFLYGLALGNHWMSMMVYTPGLILLAVGASADRRPEAREAISMGALMTLGVSLYLYLPLRAVLNPEMNWGEPFRWAEFKFNFLRAQYQQAEGTGTVGVWLRQWIYYAKTLIMEFPGLLPFSVAGAWVAWKRERHIARGFLLTWVLMAFVIGVYLNLKPDKYHLISAYALSSHIFLLLFAAWFVGDWIARAPAEATGWRGPTGRRKTCLVLVLVLLAGSIGWRALRQNQSRYTYSYDYLLNTWRGLPPGAMFFVRGDGIVFPGWYFQWIENRRRDLALVGVDGLPMKWIRVTLQGMHPGLRVPFPETQVPFVGNESIAPMTRFLYYSNEDRARYFSYNKIEDASVPELRLVPYGLAYQGVLPPLDNPTPPLDEDHALNLWRTMRLRGLEKGTQSLDSRTRDGLLKDYAVIRNGLGVYYEDLADIEKIKAEREKRPLNTRLLEHLYQQCHQHFQWAHRWAPQDHEFAFNLGNAYYNLGRPKDAVEWYKRSTELNPQYAESYYNWGVAEYQLSNFQRAGELFDQVIKLDPDKKEASDALQYMMYQGMYRRSAF
jgi:hypothetical protein